MVVLQSACWCVYYDKRIFYDNIAVWYKKDHTAQRKNLRCNDFYSIVLSIIFFISDPSLININSVISAFTPLMSRTWYFLSNYLIILLLSPFLNKMLASLSKKHYLYFMGIVFVVVSLWSTLAEIDGVSNVISVNKVLDPYMGKSLGGFLLMYIIGGYLRLFVKQQPLEKRKLNFKYLGIFAALCVSDFVLASVFRSTSRHSVCSTTRLSSPNRQCWFSFQRFQFQLKICQYSSRHNTRCIRYPRKSVCSWLSVACRKLQQ